MPTLPQSARRPVAVVLALVLLVTAATAATAAALFLPARSSSGLVSETGESNGASPVELQFTDATGRIRSFAEFRGKALLLNFWVTWCAPCREEMPTLDRLQAKLGGPDFQVVALSLDRGGPDRVGRFLAEIGSANLSVYLADATVVRRSLGIFGLPTTLLLDRDGHEVDRVVGPAEWDSPERITTLRDKLDLSAPLAKSPPESTTEPLRARAGNSGGVCATASGSVPGTCLLPEQGPKP